MDFFVDFEACAFNESIDCVTICNDGARGVIGV
jgi:hypothetical protein